MDELEDFKTYCECKECHAFRSGMVESLKDQLAQSQAEVERLTKLIDVACEMGPEVAAWLLEDEEEEHLGRQDLSTEEDKDAKD